MRFHAQSASSRAICRSNHTLPCAQPVISLASLARSQREHNTLLLNKCSRKLTLCPLTPVIFKGTHLLNERLISANF